MLISSFIFCGIAIILLPLPCKLFGPFVLFKSDQHSVRKDGERPFDQHPVRGEQRYLFVLGELRQLFAEAQRLVGVAAGVEKFLQRLPRKLPPRFYLIGGGVFRLNVALRIFDLVFLEPAPGSLTCCSLWVTE